jgi:plastocyanin
MTLTLSAMVWIFLMTGIVISLTSASAHVVLFDISLVAYAQPSANEQPETQQEVDTIVHQGTATSSQDPLPGHEEMQMATILPFRQDGTLCSGVITYTATVPVEVVILNMQILNETERDISNATDDGEFGTLFTSQLDNQTSLSGSYITPSYAGSPVPSASIPFVGGNAVWLHTIDGTPFTATFAVNALILTSQIQNIFNDPVDTTDADAAEEGADGEAAEDVDGGATAADGLADGVTEDGIELNAEEDEEATAARGDDDDDASTAPTAADGSAEDSDGGNNEEMIVRIAQGSSSLTDDAYMPNPIEVNTGDTITWINDDSTPHTATSGTPDSGSTGIFGGTDDSPEIIGSQGDTQSFTFDEAGEFEYYCTLHPSMVGTVIVTEG